MAVATANSKKLLAPISAPGAAIEHSILNGEFSYVPVNYPVTNASASFQKDRRPVQSSRLVASFHGTQSAGHCL